ncbi:DUF3558 family protein [Gordonia zhenghanii]|uniref:DUF3558 family protein n=1 Tax=Gordonia zhenghanii TaxID=2911516 RepID=UPI003556B94D
MRSSGLPIAAAAICLLAGCMNDGAQEGAAGAPSPSIRQVDDAGTALPFETKHSRRWGPANNGTTYEPCTALQRTQLTSLGINPTTASDAAGTDGQTLRGCDWKYANGNYQDHWNLSQFVGNSPGLDFAKTRRSGGTNEWLPDVGIAGRQVGVHIYTTGDQCDTYVQSRGASVITMVTHYGQSQPPINEICDRALAFTRATIGKMPV